MPETTAARAFRYGELGLNDECRCLRLRYPSTQQAVPEILGQHLSGIPQPAFRVSYLQRPLASAVLIHTHPFLLFLLLPFFTRYDLGKSGKSSEGNKMKTSVKERPRVIDRVEGFFFSLKTNHVKKKMFDG